MITAKISNAIALQDLETALNKLHDYMMILCAGRFGRRPDEWRLDMLHISHHAFIVFHHIYRQMSCEGKLIHYHMGVGYMFTQTSTYAYMEFSLIYSLSLINVTHIYINFSENY